MPATVSLVFDFQSWRAAKDQLRLSLVWQGAGEPRDKIPGDTRLVAGARGDQHLAPWLWQRPWYYKQAGDNVDAAYGDGQWDYYHWSKTYDNNMTRASDAHRIADNYHQRLGWGQREVTIQNVGGTGQSRQLDIADVATQRGVEVKSGYASLSPTVRSQLAKDKLLVEEGWDIRWHFEDKASQPLKNKLKNAGIPFTGGS